LSNELNEFLNVLSLRTSLEEVLGWDDHLADYLVGAWSQFPVKEDSNKEMMIALYTAQLPQEKYELFAKNLEKWLTDNYNTFTR